MLYSGKQIVAMIKGHIRKRGGAYSSWVVGISADARNRLFIRHRVQKKNDRWILIHAESASVARKVRSYLMKKIGIGGGPKAKDEEKTADFVYAYKKSAHTRP